MLLNIFYQNCSKMDEFKFKLFKLKQMKEKNLYFPFGNLFEKLTFNYFS